MLEMTVLRIKADLRAESRLIDVHAKKNFVFFKSKSSKQKFYRPPTKNRTVFQFILISKPGLPCLRPVVLVRNFYLKHGKPAPV